jgi:adenine-specific DNA-methyltransferase
VIAFPGELALAAMAVALGAAGVAGWSDQEQELAVAARAHAAPPAGTRRVRALIQAGADPLGEAFCQLRSPAVRRASGQTFTPSAVIEPMIAWAAKVIAPARVVDPGTGSARFLRAAGRRWPAAALAGAETDPLAAMIGRATLAAAGMAGRASITLADYRSLRLPPAPGPTLFLGNPPYVRHHDVAPQWKDWLRGRAAELGLRASALAGTHVHFFLATARHAVPGDAGVLVTAAEWLEVNYGSLVRALLLGPLGGESVHVLDRGAPVFADAMATSAITCFLPGRAPRAIRLRQVAGLEALRDLSGGTAVPVAALPASAPWRLPTATSRRRGSPPAGQVELGELCRVHRGQVTGANKVWITPPGQVRLPPRFLFPAVTRARELFAAGDALASPAGLRCVIDLPADLDALAETERALVSEFLARARAAGAADSYIACQRNPWWRVKLRPPAPILASYMARRSPAFVRNLAGAAHVNIAHGLYPRQPLPEAALDGLAAFLRRSVSPGQGRTYAGGLAKFEPGEMARLPVPEPALLPAFAGVRSSRGTTSAPATTSRG